MRRGCDCAKSGLGQFDFSNPASMGGEAGSIAGTVASGVTGIPGLGSLVGEIGGILGSLIGGKPSADHAYGHFIVQNGIPVFQGVTNEEGKTLSDVNTKAEGIAALVEKMIQATQYRGGYFNMPNGAALVFQYSYRDPTQICYHASGGIVSGSCANQWQQAGSPGDPVGAAQAVWSFFAQYATVPVSDLNIQEIAQSVASAAPAASSVPYPAQAPSAYSATPAPVSNNTWLLLGGGVLLAILALKM